MAKATFKDNKRLFDNHSKSNYTSYIYKILWFILIIFVFYISSSWFVEWWAKASKFLKGQILTATTETISNTIWQVAKTDTNGNVNVLLVWIGGKWHQWWYSTDTIMVASFSPQNESLSFLSIPRDMRVNISTWYQWRINALFYHYFNKNQSTDDGMIALKEKISEMIWLEIPYYAIIDFQWFKKAIDILWWLPINVPTTLDDYTYPDDERRTDLWWWWVNHLYIESWHQIMDGDTALKYARSRHSTSDFDRSARQQAIIAAVIDKLISTDWIANIGNLYNQYKESVQTNFNIQEIIWLSKYINSIKNKASRTLPSDCIKSINQMQAWCIMYSPNREDFGWAAVLLPEWARRNTVSNYTSIQKFANIIFSNPKTTQIDIYIANAVDKKFANKYGWSNGIWEELWITIKKYWLRTIKAINSEDKVSQNYIIPLWTWTIDNDTLSVIGNFINANVISQEDRKDIIYTWSTWWQLSWFWWFDKLKEEIQAMSWETASNWADAHNIKAISDIQQLTWWILIIVWNQYLIDQNTTQ